MSSKRNKRPSGKRKQQAKAASLTAQRCYHGGLPETNPKRQRRQAAIGILNNKRRELGSNQFGLVSSFMDEYAAIIDEDMWRLAMSLAADAVLEGNTVLARDCMNESHFFRTFHTVGQHEFARAVKHVVKPGAEMPDWMKELVTLLNDRNSERDTVVSIADAIPCDCLSQHRKDIRASVQKTGHCAHCKTVILKADLLQCSRCKVTDYCSAECQVAAWKAGHKEFCALVSGKGKGRQS